MSWFGNQDATLDWTESNNNLLWGASFTCSEDGTIVSLHAKLRNTHLTLSKKAVIGLYVDATKAKVCQTAELVLPKNSAGWISGAAVGSVVAGVKYRFGVATSCNFPYGFFSYSALLVGESGYKVWSYNPVLPDPFPTYDFDTNNKFNVYCTYTVAAVGQPYTSRVQHVQGMHSWIR